MKRVFSVILALMLCLSVVCFAEGDSDLAYVQANGKLVVGITDYKPMDYLDESGEWIGFDADLARLFADQLGVAVEFVEIDWDNKLMELDNKSIDVIWNGMTLTDDVKAASDTSEPYAVNAQVVVVPADKAEDYQTVESLADLTIAVENGSAGEEVVNELGLATIEVGTQADALMEVAAGTSDAAVIDILMAQAMVGDGTDYANLAYTVSLNSEEYGIAFRKGSDMVTVMNDFLASAYADGIMKSLSETYGVAIIEP